MAAFTNFLANNYVWFLIISLILLFALIGYLVDVNEMKHGKRQKKREELKVVDFSTVDQNKSLTESIKDDSNNLNLDEYVNKSKKEEEVQDDSVNLNDESSELPDLDFGETVVLENEFQEDVKK